jgi:hypothetical protein
VGRVAVGAALAVLALGAGPATAQTYGPPAYQEIQQRLASGWNTWNTRSVTSYVLLPEGLAINLAFKQHNWLDEKYLAETLIGRYGEGVEAVTPGPHAYDGSYTRLRLRWQELDAVIESGHDGEDLVLLITPQAASKNRIRMVVEAGMLWNRPGHLSFVDGSLSAQLPNGSVRVYSTAEHAADPYVETMTPHLAILLEGTVGVSTGRARSVGEIRSVLDQRAAELEAEAASFGELSEAFVALQAGVAWNLIYEPKFDRAVSTVGRLWNAEYGGYCLFGWDNFFLAYVTALSSRDLAYANVLEHLRGKTEEGFIPNDNRGNDSKSFDRSQPPVGALMVREVYRRYPERWFLEAVFDDLLGWNRWWMKKRVNEGLLSYGSHATLNPFNEPHVRTMRTAGYESGMDDSPMYEGVVFNPEKSTMELQDVGLNSLVIADSLALAEMAAILGRSEEERELRDRAALLGERMEGLWDEEFGLYLNRNTATGELSERLSPTHFYPLLARLPASERAEAMVRDHLLNPEEFWGEWVLPSIARSDPTFPKQRYWKGAIWPPLNFLTYLAMRQYGFESARAELAQKSLAMFLTEWRRKGYVSENYSSITGTGDDERLSSDNFHSWGTLFALSAFIEAGHLSPPEAPLEN